MNSHLNELPCCFVISYTTFLRQKWVWVSEYVSTLAVPLVWTCWLSKQVFQIKMQRMQLWFEEKLCFSTWLQTCCLNRYIIWHEDMLSDKTKPFWCWGGNFLRKPRPYFNMNTIFHVWDSHYKDKMVSQPSHLYNEIYIGKMAPCEYIQDTWIIVFCEVDFQSHAPFQCWELI